MVNFQKLSRRLKIEQDIIRRLNEKGISRINIGVIPLFEHDTGHVYELINTVYIPVTDENNIQNIVMNTKLYGIDYEPVNRYLILGGIEIEDEDHIVFHNGLMFSEGIADYLYQVVLPHVIELSNKS